MHPPAWPQGRGSMRQRHVEEPSGRGETLPGTRHARRRGPSPAAAHAPAAAHRLPHARRLSTCRWFKSVGRDGDNQPLWMQQQWHMPELDCPAGRDPQEKVRRPLGAPPRAAQSRTVRPRIARASAAQLGRRRRGCSWRCCGVL